MKTIENKHRPGCMLCAHEKSRIIRAGFRGFNKHWYCDNPKPCNGFIESKLKNSEKEKAHEQQG